MKDRDRRQFFDEMIDFLIGKWHFWVRGWSGAVWELLERKKEKTKCSYRMNTAPNSKVQFRIVKLFSKIENAFFNLHFAILDPNFDEILSESRQIFEKISKSIENLV